MPPKSTGKTWQILLTSSKTAVNTKPPRHQPKKTPKNPALPLHFIFWPGLRIERGDDSRTTVMVRNVAGNNARKEPGGSTVALQ